MPLTCSICIWQGQVLTSARAVCTDVRISLTSRATPAAASLSDLVHTPQLPHDSAATSCPLLHVTVVRELPPGPAGCPSGVTDVEVSLHGWLDWPSAVKLSRLAAAAAGVTPAFSCTSWSGGPGVLLAAPRDGLSWPPVAVPVASAASASKSRLSACWHANR